MNNRGYSYLLFILSPVMSLVMAFKGTNLGTGKNILWLFVIFYASLFVIASESNDAYRHVEDFKLLYAQQTLTFSEFKEIFLSEQADIFTQLLKYTVSRFTGSSKVLFISLGIIFGFFYSRNIFLLLEFGQKKIGREFLIFVVAFALIYAPWEMNSFRFPLATHIFVFAVLNLMLFKKKRYWVLILACPLFHFGLVFPVLVLLLYLLIGNRLKLYFILLAFSLLPFTPFSTGQLASMFPDTGSATIEKRKNSYLTENYLDRRQAGIDKVNWYVTLRFDVLKYAVIGLLFWLYFYRRSALQNSSQLGLLCFALLLMAVSNTLIGVVGSVGRFLFISQIFALAFIVLLSKTHLLALPKLVKQVVYPCLLLYIIVDFRVGFYYTPIDVVFSNPVLSLFGETNLTFDELLEVFR